MLSPAAIEVFTTSKNFSMVADTSAFSMPVLAAISEITSALVTGVFFLGYLNS
jgi:hypothetical protein